MAKNMLVRAKILKVFHAGIDVQPVTPCSFSPKIIYVSKRLDWAFPSALFKQIENGVLKLSDRNGEVTITGRCFIDRYVNPNNSNSPQSKTTCWIGIRARRQFYSCLFIMCSEVLTCRKCLPSYNIFMQPRLCRAQIWTAMVLTP